MRSKTISREFFASVATVVILGLGVVCLSQTAMSVGYFASERRAALTGILDGAAVISEQLAAGEGDSNIIITEPIPIHAAPAGGGLAGAVQTLPPQTLVFVTDENGNVLLHTGGDVLTGESVPAELLSEIDVSGEVFTVGDMDGVFSSNYYVLGRAIEADRSAGYLFAATPTWGRWAATSATWSTCFCCRRRWH